MQRQQVPGLVNTDPRAPGLWTGQGLHSCGLAALLAMTWLGWSRLGEPVAPAFWIAVAVPIVHQVFVWLAWRLELRSGATSRTIGFTGYVASFFVLFGGRFVALVALAWFDRGSMGITLLPRAVVTAMLLLPGLYAMISVMRYFGMQRAAGADHFDPKFRQLPLVTRGIFRFTNNGMYVYAFMLFWAVGVGFDSSAALLVAAFSHAYIWVHFFATEQPDMRFIYEGS